MDDHIKNNIFRVCPFILLVPALISGILLCEAYPDYRIQAWILLLICTGFIIREIRPYEENYTFFFIFLIIILSGVWGYLSLQPYMTPRFPPDHLIHYTDQKKWIITGFIKEEPLKYEDRLKFVMQVQKLGRETRVTGRLRVTLAGKNLPNLWVGDRISFVSRIKSVRSFGNPGGFDYGRYMAFQWIWVTASVHGPWLDLFEVLEKSDSSAGLGRFRGEISGLISETGPGDHIGVLKALIIGERSEISEDMWAYVRRAGIAHLLAISGLHIGIVAGIAFVLFKRIFSSLLILWEAWIFKIAAVLSLFPTLGYGLLAGMQPSTQRAVIMASAFLMTFLVDKTKPDMRNALAGAAFAILAINPPFLFSASFQLSFAAVISIMYGYPKTYNYIFARFLDTDRFSDKWYSPLLTKLVSFFLVSFFAILGTGPLGMYHFNQLSLIGLLSNFIFIPLIGFVVVPSGLLSVILLLFNIDFLAFWSMRLSAMVLEISLKLVPLFSGLSFGFIKTPAPTILEICCYYLLLGAVLSLIPGPEEKERKDERHRQKRVFAVIIIVFVVFIGIADAYHWFHERFWHKDLRITVIDVGQGSAALAEIPGGDAFLLDGGGFPDNSMFDVGKNILEPFLLFTRIRTIDRILLSHPDSDHLNGLLHIVKEFNVKAVWTNHDEADSPTYQAFTEIIREKHIIHPELKRISGSSERIRGVRIEVLYPRADFMLTGDKWRERKNNNSLVVKITFGSVSFLFPGDIEAPAEEELVTLAGDRLRSTFLIAPHHGSKSSSTDVFLDAVRPEYVIISAGWQNRFGFPHQSVMERYKARGCKIYRTDIHGAIRIRTDGLSLKSEIRISKPETNPKH